MALGNNNPFLQKISGTLGDTVTFKQRNGETIICKKSRPSKTESPKQKWKRDQFRSASYLAKQLLLDPEKEREYIEIAKRRKLSNPYTAANQDMLKLIHTERWEDSAMYAQMLRAPTQHHPEDDVTADDAKDSIVNGNGQANIFGELLKSYDRSSLSGNVELSQQIAELTGTVQNCMLELQKAMAKATELLQTGHHSTVLPKAQKKASQ